MRRVARWIPIIVLVALAATIWFRFFRKAAEVRTGRHSVASRLKQYGDAARSRLRPAFENAGVEYPPPHMTWLALKEEKLLEIFATDANGAMRLVATYPILGTSGKPGPKLREGDLQIPEGFYRIESLNPNSAYHLALRVNYPSPFDLEHAKAEGRAEPGSDIMIHGSTGSIGCLAMGDEAAEDFFVLAADSGLDSIELLIAPHDFRIRPEATHESPEWMPAVYDRLRTAMAGLPGR